MTRRLLIIVGSLIVGLLVGWFIVGPALKANATDTPQFTAVKYGQEFNYYGNNIWTITNTDGSKAIKDIDPQQEVLCSDYDTGLGKPCALNAVYQFTSHVTVEGFESCAYVQIDGGANGSQDTVPGDPSKRVCAATVTPTPTPDPEPTITPDPEPTPDVTPEPEHDTLVATGDDFIWKLFVIFIVACVLGGIGIGAASYRRNK